MNAGGWPSLGCAAKREATGLRAGGTGRVGRGPIARPPCSATGPSGDCGLLRGPQVRDPEGLGDRSRLCGRGRGSPPCSHRPRHLDTEPRLGLLWERDARKKEKNRHFPPASAPRGDAERSPAMRAGEAGRPLPAGPARNARGVAPALRAHEGRLRPESPLAVATRRLGGAQAWAVTGDTDRLDLRPVACSQAGAAGEPAGTGPVLGLAARWPCPGPTVTKNHRPGGSGDRAHPPAVCSQMSKVKVSVRLGSAETCSGGVQPVPAAGGASWETPLPPLVVTWPSPWVSWSSPGVSLAQKEPGHRTRPSSNLVASAQTLCPHEATSTVPGCRCAPLPDTDALTRHSARSRPRPTLGSAGQGRPVSGRVDETACGAAGIPDRVRSAPSPT